MSRKDIPRLDQINLAATDSESSTIDDRIHRPGTVDIDVTGAFITDDGAATPIAPGNDGARHETEDIRLPHHTSVVSHVAVDVS